MPIKISIRKRLLIGVIGAILLGWFVVIGLVYQTSQEEIGEIYDASLASYARVLTALMAHEAQEEDKVHQQLEKLVDEIGIETVNKSSVLSGLMAKYQSSASAEDYLTLDLTKVISGHYYESKIAFLVKSADGNVLMRSASRVPFQEIINGYQTLRLGDENWRVFGLTEPENALAVMVGEKIAIRTELQNEIIINSLWPFFAMLPVIALIILIVISRGLKPVQSVTEKVSKRSPSSLERISLDTVPLEIFPLVEELNKLFQRIEQALENERRFTSNAAHELRTPLAALKTNVQILQMNATTDMQPVISRVLHGIDRATHLVEQLLTLARSEARGLQGIAFEQIDLVPIIRGVMSECVNLALEKNITLSFDTETENFLVAGDKGLIEIVLRNIFDNAVRYTPLNGRVNAVIEQAGGALKLRIEDSGPGIDPEKQELMFQRFQRGGDNEEQGVGLGLFIVRQIVGLHGIDLTVENATPTGGLIVTLAFRQEYPA